MALAKRFVYILLSTIDPARDYSGLTCDVVISVIVLVNDDEVDLPTVARGLSDLYLKTRPGIGRSMIHARTGESWMIMCGRAAVALLVLMALATPSDAQQNERRYAGGTFTAFTQTHSETQPLGGTTWNGSVFVGGWVSPRLAIEVEPSFGRTFSWEYSYRPGPSFTADVVASRRDTFWAGQVRTRAGVVEPVFGLAYMHANLQRHATVAGRPYFDDSRTKNGVAGVLGLDAPVKVAPHVYLLPTFRLLLNFGPVSESSGVNDPLGAQTSTGHVLFRYGAGARVTF